MAPPLPAVFAFIPTVMPLIQSALGIIGAFKGSAQAAKITDGVQDALAVVAALTPLLTQWGSGTQVTADDVRTALAGLDTTLDDFEALAALKRSVPK